MRVRNVALSLGFLLAGAALAQEMDIEVELLGPLGTETSRKGDRITGRVLSPSALRGDIVEGKVTESKAGGKLHGRSVLNFTFETLDHGGQAIPIASQVTKLTNSQGRVDVDEEGRVIRKSSNLGKAAAGTGAGALIGGLAGGRRGAAIGAGVGAAASIILIEVAAEGPNIRFAPGSKVSLSAKSRKGPALASLAANQPAAAPSSAPAEPAPEPAAAPATAPAPAAAEQPAPAAQAGNQPDLAAVKADFIPGEKAVFYDDFTDMAGDEPPPHWKVRGGSVELRVGGGIRQLTVTKTRTQLTANLTSLPANFTLETEIKFEKSAPNNSLWANWYLHEKDWTGPTGPYAALTVHVTTQHDKLFGTVGHRVGKNNTEELGRFTVPVDFGQPVKEAIWVQNGRLRVYINGQRVVDANQVELPPLTGADLLTELSEGAAIGYRMVRLAESTPDFSQVIASAGRYVTHGIHFDTDSDRLKPESAAVIKTIAAGLEKNPNLKLLIEGHTDSVGNADHNLDLSKRRAESVKAVLVSQFNVDSGRLTTGGLGPSKPIDSNDTPQGRAQNRRVEFVKQ